MAVLLLKRVVVLNYDFDMVAIKSCSSEYEIIQRTYLTESEISDEIDSAHILIVGRSINISISTIQRLKNCLAIIRPGVGSDNIDSVEAEKRNIMVYNTPDYCIDEVADHTMALLLSYARRVSSANERFKAGNDDFWTPHLYADMGRLRDKTLGIIGMGCIGQAVARRASSFNMKISYYDPYLKQGMRKVLNANALSSICELLNTSDYVSLHVPLTSQTKEIITSVDFEKMESSVVIINTSRGKIISNDTIFLGLTSGKIEAFLADVLEKEPPNVSDPLIKSYIDNEVWIRDRLIITPHIAYLSKESTKEVISQIFRLIADILVDAE